MLFRSSRSIIPAIHFDGLGHVGGFDLQLQRMESRYWDGWISYTFTYAKYKNPVIGEHGVDMMSIDGGGGEWVFPSFHRFHNANLVFNIKPLRWLNITTRFGFASGTPSTKRVYDDPYSYPVIVFDEDGIEIVQKYARNSTSTPSRSSWSLPWDIKVSFFLNNRKGKSGMEVYIAAENLTSLFYKPGEETTRLNEYTGKLDTVSTGGSGMFDFPIPMFSFGFKWRY